MEDDRTAEEILEDVLCILEDVLAEVKGVLAKTKDEDDGK